MFRRKIYDEILSWKKKKAGRYALLIEGARRVGKSTIIEEFVRREYDSYVIISFEKAKTEIKDLFKRMDDLDSFFLYLQQLSGTTLHERRSAIVFDEVQLFPLARQSIKTLVEDGRYDYYETESLISIKKNVKDILIPSEEDTIRMYPMDFEEFLWARGDEMTMPFVKGFFEKMAPLGNTMHERVMRQFREYMITGGMPQAVQALVSNNSFSSVEEIKKTILDLYLKDAAKLDGARGNNKASSILRALPSNLEKHDKTFSPGVVKRNASVRDYLATVNDLSESMMINMCFRITEPSTDQNSHRDETDFKIYMGDTGLLLTLSFSDLACDMDEIYGELINGNLNVNQGMYFENAVAQQLKASGHGLFFAKFQHESSDRLQEVDFIIVRDRKPTPIEVKSGRKSKTHASLDRYMDKYGHASGQAIVVHSKDLEIDGDVVYIPIYMASLLRSRTP